MSKTVILAEKPSVANNIAFALGCKVRKDGYIEGDNYIVTFAVGHLLTLLDAKEYDPRLDNWELDYFPFFPDSFKYRLKDDSGLKKQFKIIKDLVNRSDVDTVINACDNDREGEIIGDSILAYAGCKKNIKRLLVNEQTPTEIKHGMSNLKDITEMRNLQKAGYTRQITDWLIGINLTSVVTKKFSDGETLNIGRLLLAIVKLIYDRDLSIRSFHPKIHYELKALFKSPNGTYDGFYIENDIIAHSDTNTGFNGFCESLQGSQGCVISKITNRVKQGPPKLFNMSDLQGFVTSRFNGWTASKVLKVAQNLYEKKLISYPRTASRYLEESLKSKTKKVFDAHSNAVLRNCSFNYHEEKSIFDTSKVIAHSAIIPTYIIPESNLSNDELIVYKAIQERFLSQFLPDAVYEVTEIVTRTQDHDFLTKGRILISEGWKSLLNVSEDEDKGDNRLAIIPNVNMGDNVEVDGIATIEKRTSAPSRYTEKTLLKAMENCGKDVAEDDINNVLEGFTIGTEATRADAIKTVLDVGYVEMKGKSFYITSVGSNLVEKIPFGRLLDIAFTGSLEKKLKSIEMGSFEKDTYINEVKTLVSETVNAIKSANVSLNIKRDSLGKCPSCGKDVMENPVAYSCSGYKDGCKFAIWKKNKLLERFGIKSINKKLATALLTGAKITIKIGYDTLIFARLNHNNDKWDISFDFPSKDETLALVENLGACPACGKPVHENSHGFYCEGGNKDDPNSCSFFISKTNALLERYSVGKVPKPFFKDMLKGGEVTLKVSPTCFLIGSLEKSDGRWNINFKFPSKEENMSMREVLGICPDCGANVYENNFSYMCENSKKEGSTCNFTLYKEDKWFSKYHKKVNKSMAKSLLNAKRVHVKDLFSEAKNKTFEADVVMEKNGRFWNFKFDFNK